MIDGIRWIEVSDREVQRMEGVFGFCPGWEGSRTYFKLQYLDTSGRWCDVETALSVPDTEGK